VRNTMTSSDAFNSEKSQKTRRCNYSMQDAHGQERRQVFRARGSRSSGCRFTAATPFHPPPPSFIQNARFARISWVIRLEAGGPDPWTSRPAAAPADSLTFPASRSITQKSQCLFTLGHTLYARTTYCRHIMIVSSRISE